MQRSFFLVLSLSLSITLVGCGDDGGTPTTHGGGADVADTAAPEADTAAPEADMSAPEADTTPEPEPDATPTEPDTTPEPDVTQAEPTFGTGCTQNSRVGHFQVTHDDAGGFEYAAVSGTVASGVIPLTILQPVKEVGDCRMLQKVNPFCDPPCTGGELCTHDGGCIPYPANQKVGTVSISGLLKDPLTMEPNTSDYYTDVDVPFPLFEPEAQIDLVAPGDEVDGFSLRAWGVPTVELPDVIWEMEAGQPLTIDWIAEPGPWKMIVSLNVDQHGNSPVTMFCEVEDNGTTVVSAELIDALLGYGVSGFATADFRRTTRDSVEIDVGCVQMSVESLKLGKLTVAGHTPCKTPLDCPDGYECNFPIETCEPVE